MSDYIARVLVALTVGAFGYVSYWLIAGAAWQWAACAGSALAVVVAIHFAFLMSRILKQGWSS